MLKKYNNDGLIPLLPPYFHSQILPKHRETFLLGNISLFYITVKNVDL